MKHLKVLIYTLSLMLAFMICRADQVSVNSSEKCFKTLFQFGASLFDTGNAVIAFPQQAFQPSRSPYGSTFPGHPANRFCDGKLIIDHLAEALKVPLLNPFLGGFQQFTEKGANSAPLLNPFLGGFQQFTEKGANSASLTGSYANGVCFSVALATAMSVAELTIAGIGRPNQTLNPLTLDVQYMWFQMFSKAAIAKATMPGKLWPELPSPKAFENALYLPGEFGGNDYRAGLLSGLSIEQVKRMVPSVVGKILQLIKNLYEVGARNFLVIGVPPQGCTPFYLTMLNGSRDELNCLAEVNEIHELHESKLRMALRDLRGNLRGSNIMFADYYGAFISVLKDPAKYGMEVLNVACCGGGGPYNYNPQAVCGTNSSARCSNPKNHVFWDDFHTTDTFNHMIADKFLSGKYVDPLNIKLGCRA